jgi:cytochrome c oxidase subunit I
MEASQAFPKAGPVLQDYNYLNANYGIRSWLLTVDHKRIAILYLVSITFMFAVGGIFAAAIRVELLTPVGDLVQADTYNKLFTMHGIVMIFFFLIPSIPAVLGNFLIPMMLGARDLAFPRINLLSWYLYIAGAVIAAYAIFSGGIDTGWTFYTPYSTSASQTHVLSTVFGAFIVGFSSILTGLNFIVTTHKMRAPGLTWFRLPLFVWAIYATSLIQVLATPVLAITLVLLLLERGLHIGIFDPKLGGDPVLFQHLFWFYSHPAVYIMILPGMGVISEIVPCFTRRRIFGYPFIAFSSFAIAMIGFLVWGHHLFVSGMSEYATMVFSALTFLVAIPSGVKVFNWVATMHKASISLESPMLWALAFVFQFTIGGLTGLFLGMLAVDIHLHDTYFVVAHFHYVMVGGTVMGFVGGLHYWWPKFTGKLYDEKLARLGFTLVFIGFNVTFMIQFILGSRGMPRRYYDYLPEYQQFHAISTYGSWILGAGFFLLLYMFIMSLLKGKKAPRNPWGSASLEWQVPSPAPLGNFLKEPKITRGPYDYHLATPEELETE